jgi:hypothetical protein
MILGLEQAMKTIGFYTEGIAEIDGMETELQEFMHKDNKYSYFREGNYSGYYEDGNPIEKEAYDRAFYWEECMYYGGF